ncbi:hypothetical protein X798_04517 [Onchocerca flexuosa]|uniref:Uncharacterized protein n=1 Tax=Onchocerca flexuosa TaxID=387005 RepID=A0A238BSW6_9BILA|nr:hypothetical protein X798_04517 [Onchocerca flexuosa]
MEKGGIDRCFPETRITAQIDDLVKSNLSLLASSSEFFHRAPEKGVEKKEINVNRERAIGGFEDKQKCKQVDVGLDMHMNECGQTKMSMHGCEMQTNRVITSMSHSGICGRGNLGDFVG